MLFIHRPRFVRSGVGFGSGKNSVVRFVVSGREILTTEFWNVVLVKPWKIGGVVVAQKGYSWKTRWELGKHFVITDIYDASGGLVGTYFYITSEVTQVSGDFAFDDWYLGIWLVRGKESILLKEEELEEARVRKYLSNQEVEVAKWTAFELMESMRELLV